MTNILLVTSSPRGDASYSTKVAKALVERLKREQPDVTVTARDLVREPLPHVGEQFVAGLFATAESRSEAQRVEVARSDALVDELLAADVVVIASAMINFAPTSTLKAWLDHVVRAGRTFRYSAEGVPEGLATAKKVYLIAARGAVYSEGPTKAFDFQEPYLRHILGFLGMTDIEVIPVEGTIFGPEHAEKSLSKAVAQASASLALAA